MEAGGSDSSALGRDSQPAPGNKGGGRVVRRVVMGLLPPAYAVVYVAAMLVIWWMAGLGIASDPLTLCLIPLAIFIVLSLPSLVGLTGRIGPFALSWGLTVLSSILILYMMSQTDACGICIITLFFMPIVLLIVIVTTLVSGAWAALAALFGTGGPKWPLALTAVWMLICAVLLVAFAVSFYSGVAWVQSGCWLIGCCWLLAAVVGTASLSVLHLIVSRRAGKGAPAE